MYRKMLFVTSLFFMTFSSAEVLRANYLVSYGVFGEIGTAKALLIKDDKNYSITIKLEATGLAKLLSKGRKEEHISRGRVENGILLSERYEVNKSYGKKETSKVYTIDQQRQKVLKRYVKKEHGKIISDEHTDLPYYAKNDLLTLYFNLNKLISNKTEVKNYTFYAVGAERQRGTVKVSIPDRSVLPTYKQILNKDAAWYATVIIYQKIFSSQEGRLMLSVGKDGIAQKAVLKDVVFFGDIVAVLQ